MKNSYFVDNDGSSLNKWINELLSEDINDPNSLINNLDFMRSLGTNDKEFEDYSE